MTTSAVYYLGRPFVYPTESLIGRFLERGRGWDNVLQTLLKALVPEENPVICEIGSNIGASLMQILAAKPGARVLAFEPSDRFRPYLLRNLDLAGATGSVEIYPWAVGKEPDTAMLYNNTSSASAVSRGYGDHEPRGEQEIQVVKLDDVLDGRVDFVKIDTDGFEFEALRGAETILRDNRPALSFEFTPYLIPSPVDGLTWLSNLGYERYLCLTPRGEPIGVTGDPDQAVAWTNDDYCDIVACHES